MRPLRSNACERDFLLHVRFAPRTITKRIKKRKEREKRECETISILNYMLLSKTKSHAIIVLRYMLQRYRTIIFESTRDVKTT